MNPHFKINKKQMALLRLAAAQVGADYADLKRRAGVASAKDLTNAKFDELMRHLTGCGFVYRPTKVQGSKFKVQSSDISRLTAAKQVHMAAIETILNAVGKPWAYAEGIARQMNFPAKLEWLSPEQLHKVQVALIYHAGRRERVSSKQ